MAFLARRGYSADVAGRAIRAALAADDQVEELTIFAELD
jgi:hypothetical protein